MKKSVLLLLLAAAVAAFSACSDSEDAETWREFPTAPVSGDNAVIAVNGEPTQGSVQLVPASAAQGELTLTDLLPGFAQIKMEVAIAEQADGSFDFSGEKELTTVAAVKAAAAQPAIMRLSVQGNMTAAGTVKLDAKSALTAEAQDGLSGTWRLLPAPQMDPETEMPSLTPLFLVWTAVDVAKPNMQMGAMMANLFGSMILFDALDSVTLHEDGNITARYWSEIGVGGMDDNNNFIHTHEEWLESPKSNLAFWHVRDGLFYVVPDIDAILRQAAKDNGGEDAQPADIEQVLAQLEALGVDAAVLRAALEQWAVTGIPLRYAKQEGSLKLYADKQMVAPFMAALLPALPKLDEMLVPILADENNETGSLIKMAFGMLGIEKLADIKTIWETNTADFELAINLVAAEAQK